VRLVSEQEALEILEARTALETIVAGHAARNAVPAEVAALKSLLTAMERCCKLNDIAGYVELDTRLHQQINEIARHTTAMRLLSLLKSQLVRYQYRILYAPGRLNESVTQHRKIIDAIAKRNPEAAERAMRAHFDGAFDILNSLAVTDRKPLLKKAKTIRRKHS
jgi:DNA-binding GntR family transcriptional regulator